jgi:hypothetical protein
MDGSAISDVVRRRYLAQVEPGLGVTWAGLERLRTGSWY